MKLRRIDILGFKSFRNRTGLEIADGVTSIVGPNGCGKSNVVDAIRWVLGSQSAKDLRGRAMEDVIFAGSDTHKPMGVAEVSMTLDNNGHDLPGEWRELPEVKITRRLFRTGESEYEINGAKVRLRDIQELFLGTGVGAREAYSIIEQGRIGFIVSARPEERRIIIEEAAGITRYKFQRKTAERRLEKTRENLTRIRDILNEVSRQLASLERQAKRAAQVRELQESRNALELTLAVDRRDRIDAQLSEQTAGLAGLREAARSATTQLRILEAQSESLRVENAVQERRFTERIAEDTYRLRARSELLASNVQFQERELLQLRERAAQLDREFSERELELGIAREELQAETSRTTDIVTGLHTAQSELSERQDHQADVRERLQTAHEESRRVSGELTRLRGVVARAAGRLDSTDSERRRLQERRLSLAEEQSGLQREASRLSQRGAQASEELEGLHERVEDLDERFQSARLLESDTLKRLDATRNEERTARQQQRSAEVELQGLEASLRSGRGVGDAGRRLLEAAAKGEVQGVVRPLAERLRVPDGRDAELATALEKWIDAILVEDEPALRRVGAWCRERKLAVTLMALTEARTGSLGEYGEAFEPVPAVVFDRLFRRASVPDVLADSDVVVPSVDRKRAARPERTVVELGTDAASAAETVFRLRRQVDEAQGRMGGLQDRVVAAELQVRTLERDLESAMQQRSAMREELDAMRLRLEQVRRQAAEAKQEAERATNAELRIRQEATGIDERLEQIDSLRQELAAEVEGSEGQIRQLEVAVDQAAGLASALNDEAQRASDRVNDVRVQVSRLQEQQRSNADAVQRLERTSRDLASRLLTIRQDADSSRARAVELDARLSTDVEGRAEAEAARLDAEERLARVREKYESVAASLRDADAGILGARKQVDTATSELQRAELASERHRAELELADQTLFERFNLTPNAARAQSLPGGMTEARRVELAELNVRIERLGPVNPAAEEEFAEAHERHAFLTTQRDDLEAALADLEAAIRKMDKTSRDLFEETFHAVNERFTAIFPQLFNGGRARMELTDPANLLETGIDIIVQPPGKRLQSMTLLSGGEKALSAVALIFAIFQLRPTPFCILDEVDAPLDEANVVRFAEAVLRMSDTSQFIIITHNKRTMEAAHTLYGVTMEEPGVSKVVGVRLPPRDSAGY